MPHSCIRASIGGLWPCLRRFGAWRSGQTLLATYVLSASRSLSVLESTKLMRLPIARSCSIAMIRRLFPVRLQLVTSVRRSSLLFAAIGTLAILSSTGSAQEPLASPFPPGGAAFPASPDFLASIELVKPQPANSSLRGDELLPEKRLFGVIPNYRADQAQAIYTPITAKQKFAIAKSDSFDWPNYLLLVGYAVQSQVASGGFTHNGGTSGFAKFYARSVGDQIIGSYVTEAILPTLLHQDPRFFRLGTGSFGHRAGHAVSSIFVTKTDRGRNTFNFSEVVGNAGVVALTTVYYPNSRSASESFERLSMALGNDVVSNLMTEFWPDIKHRLAQHKNLFQSRPHED